jgi:hypothetical protein
LTWRKSAAGLLDKVFLVVISCSFFPCMVSWSPQPSVCVVHCVELFVLVVLLYKINVSFYLFLKQILVQENFPNTCPQ